MPELWNGSTTATPLLVFNRGGLFGLIGEYAVERAEKARVRGVLDRLVSKDIVRELLADRDRYAQIVRGQRQPVTALFSDVRGFTTLSEKAEDPAAFIRQLNEYLGEMVGVVFKHRGTLDKFSGEAVMAVWGSMHTDGIAADACQDVATAVEMRQRLAALNAKWTTEGKQTLAIGIGTNHGEVIVGGLSSEKTKMEITVVGDAVNTASRLESLTKEYSLDLLIGESLVKPQQDIPMREEGAAITRRLGGDRPARLPSLHVWPRRATWFRVGPFFLASRESADILTIVLVPAERLEFVRRPNRGFDRLDEVQNSVCKCLRTNRKSG